MIRKVSLQSTDGNPAFLFTGYLRGDDAEIVIESFQRVGDVFVVTNDDGSLMLREIRRRCENVVTVEENDEWASEQNKFLGMDYGRGLLQWQKFEIGLKQIRKTEDRLEKKYDTIYKLRTDLNFSPYVYIANLYHFQNNSCVFMNSDKFFGGCGDAIMKLDGFVDHALQHYCGRYGEYWPINMNCLLGSDFDAGKFHWLKYPWTVAPFSNGQLDAADLRIRLLANTEYIDLSADYLGELITCRSDIPDTSWFPSEPCFAHFVLSRGFFAKNFGDFFVQHGLNPLREDRFEHDIRATNSRGKEFFEQAMKHG